MKLRRPRPAEEKQLDMTPMIDVTFLLLIFFLCMEFKTLEGKLPMNLPKDVGSCPKEAQPIERLDLQILVAERGVERRDPRTGRRVLEGHRAKFRVGALWVRDEVALQRMLAQEARIRVPGPDGSLQLRRLRIESGRGVVYGDVTRALDAARSAGFEQIAFVAAR